MAYNSRIKAVKGKCIDCKDGKEKYLTAGRCQYHYKKHRESERKDRNESRGIVPKKSTPTRKKDQELDRWFDERKEIIALHPFCMECGEPIPEKYYRHATAHIFPKATFPSVRTSEWNYLILATTCGCHDKSHRLDTFVKMRIWPLAAERFKLFESDIQESKKYLHEFKQAVYGKVSI